MAEPAHAVGSKGEAVSAWLRRALAYEPRNQSLFQRALTHRSAEGPSNERLEFLGDAVLNLVVAERLYADFPHADEGCLSRLRARVVSGGPLAQVGAQLGVGEVIVLGGGELKSGGFRRESILADATEALIGAAFLDAGMEQSRQIVLRWFAGVLGALDPAAESKDAKTRLQELLQSRAVGLPSYDLQRVEGEPHAQTFWVRCSVQIPPGARVMFHGRDFAGRSLSSEGQGASRRRAEQFAAESLLAQLLQESPS